MKRTTTSKRYRRQATAYRRLMWKAMYAGQSRQVDFYEKMAERFERQAEREENR